MTLTSLFSLSWAAKDLCFLHAVSEHSDQTWGCSGWSESSLGIHTALFILSCGDFEKVNYTQNRSECSMLFLILLLSSFRSD